MKYNSPHSSRLLMVVIAWQVVCAAAWGKESVNPNVAKETLKLLQEDLLKARDDQAIAKISKSILTNGAPLITSEMNPSKASAIGSEKKAGTKVTPDQQYYVGFWLLRAYAAVRADDAEAGRQAAMVLKTLGIENTQVSSELKLMAALNKKNWLYYDKASVLLETARSLITTGKLEAASSCADEILKADPSNSAAREALEDIKIIRQKDLEAANSSQQPTEHDTVSYWDGDEVKGTPSIKISLEKQEAYFCKDGQLVAMSAICSGRAGNTPTGDFKILEKAPKHYDDGEVVYFMRLTKGSLRDKYGGISLNAGYLPGYPCTDGEIRLPEFMAKNFFNAVRIGTRVTITD